MILFCMRYVTLPIVAVICFALASCAIFGPRRIEMPAYTGLVSVEALSNRIAFSGVEGLRSEIRASVYQGGKKAGTFSGSFVFRAPDDMRIVLYNTFGTTIMDIVKANGTIEAYMPSEDAMYIGPAPSLMPPEGSVIRLERLESAYRLIASYDGADLRMYDFDLRSAVHSVAMVPPLDDAPAMRAEFYDYTPNLPDNDSVKIPSSVPGTIVLNYGDTLKLVMTLKDPDISRPVPERLFPLGRSAAKYYDIRSLGATETIKMGH